MTSATKPVLTSELREKLQKEYSNNRSIAAFLVWNSSVSKEITHKSYSSMAALYCARHDMIEHSWDIEEFLVVNTFKEFELD